MACFPAVAIDPVGVEGVRLPSMAGSDDLARRQVEPEVGEDVPGDVHQVRGERLVDHDVRFDAGRGEPRLPPGIVLVDEADELTDPVGVEARRLPGATATADLAVSSEVPDAGLFSPEPRHR